MNHHCEQKHRRQKFFRLLPIILKMCRVRCITAPHAYSTLLIAIVKSKKSLREFDKDLCQIIQLLVASVLLTIIIPGVLPRLWEICSAESEVVVQVTTSKNPGHLRKVHEQYSSPLVLLIHLFQQ